MSSIKLQVGDDIFEYPIVGTPNYGEQATAWAEAVTEALKEVKRPGDISTTEILINSFDVGDTTDRIVTGLAFNVAFVQRIQVRGLITREYTTLSALPNKVESFLIEGAFDGSIINFSQEGTGQDCDLEFYATGGQFRCIFSNEPDLQSVRIKFTAQVLIDENAL